MTRDMLYYEDIALEENAKEKFGFSMDIDHVIARNVPVSRSIHATIFLTKKKQLMVYIDGQMQMKFGDVQKILRRMNLVPELYIPPKGQLGYFDEVGRMKFKEVFPGRSNPGEQDLAYYKTLAPYKPALVQILEVRDGEIRQFDPDSRGDWRTSVKFAYRRIKTS